MKKAISLLFLEIVNDVRQNILNILSKMAQTRPVVYLCLAKTTTAKNS